MHGERSQPTGDFQDQMPGEVIAEASRDSNDEALLESEDIQQCGNEQSPRFEKEQGNFKGPSHKLWR